MDSFRGSLNRIAATEAASTKHDQPSQSTHSELLLPESSQQTETYAIEEVWRCVTASIV